MIMVSPCLAEGGGGWFANLVRVLSSSVSPTVQFTVVFGVFILVIIAIFAWAAFFREQGGRHHHHRRHHRRNDRSLPPLTAAAAAAQKPGDPPPFQRPHRRHRRRRRRHSDVRRNPTLAETGGLPPRRSEDTAPPGP
jgi:hypothetical protein